MSRQIVSGIYKITNKVNGKIYIGSSRNIYKRWVKHKYDLRSNIHHNIHLQNAWNNYGYKNFIFEIIDLVDEDNLAEIEQYWIEELDSTNIEKGYNISENTLAPTPKKSMIKIYSICNREMILNNKYNKNERSFIFSLLPFLCSDNNYVKIKYKFPTQDSLLKTLDMSKPTYYNTIKKLIKNNIIKIKHLDGELIIYFNPNYFITDIQIKNEIYNMFI